MFSQFTASVVVFMARFNIPDIDPNFNFPGARAVRTVISYALGAGLTLGMLALIFCVLAIVFRGFGNQQIQRFSAAAVIWVIAGVGVLASFSAVYQWIIGFDFGLTSL